MTDPDSYSYSRYLTAKKTVDARSLNRRVWTEFVGTLTDSTDTPVQILEVGGGVGATAQRLIEAMEDQSVEAVRYTLVDIEPENIDVARSTTKEWARDRGYAVSGQDTQTWSGEDLEVSIRFVNADLFDYADTREDSTCDAIVAQAVFDLLALPNALNVLRPLLRNDGLWYLPIHFDGVTAFEPVVKPSLDAKIEQLYHESMTGAPNQEGGVPGSHCGRRLFTHLRDLGASLLEAGSSDWVVFPQGDGYPGDEAYFLHHILHFIEDELRGHPSLGPDIFTNWLAERRRQVDEAELVYVAHQLDLLARSP